MIARTGPRRLAAEASLRGTVVVVLRVVRMAPAADREHRWTQQRTGGTGHHGNRSECAVHERSPSRQGTDGRRAGRSRPGSRRPHHLSTPGHQCPADTYARSGGGPPPEQVAPPPGHWTSPASTVNCATGPSTDPPSPPRENHSPQSSRNAAARARATSRRWTAEASPHVRRVDPLAAGRSPPSRR